MHEPFAVFPSWLMRIRCDRCGKDRMFAETHFAQRDKLLREIIKRMRHDGCGDRTGHHSPSPSTALPRCSRVNRPAVRPPECGRRPPVNLRCRQHVRRRRSGRASLIAGVRHLTDLTHLGSGS